MQVFKLTTQNFVPTYVYLTYTYKKEKKNPSQNITLPLFTSSSAFSGPRQIPRFGNMYKTNFKRSQKKAQKLNTF